MPTAELRSKVTADSSQFDAAINKSIGGVEALKQVAHGAAPALAGAFAAGAIASFAHEVMETGEQVFNMASRLGISTDSVQKLSFAAKQTGVDMDSLAKGIQKAQANITNGGLESEKYKKALDQLGLASQDLIGQSPEEFLLRVSDAFSKTSNRAEANAAVISLFGSKMAGLIPLLDKGREGIQTLFNEAPVIPADTISSIKEMGDEASKLKGELLVGFAAILKPLFVAVDYARALVKIIGAYIGGLLAFIEGSSLDDVAKGIDEQMTEILADIDKKPKVKLGNFEVDEAGIAEAQKAEKERLKTVEEIRKVEEEIAKLKNDESEIGLSNEQKRAKLVAEIAKMRQDNINAEGNASADRAFGKATTTPEQDEEAKKKRELELEKKKLELARLDQTIDKDKESKAERIAELQQKLADIQKDGSLAAMSNEEKIVALKKEQLRLVMEANKESDPEKALKKKIEAAQLQNKIDALEDSKSDSRKIFSNDIRARGGVGASTRAVVSGGVKPELQTAKNTAETNKILKDLDKSIKDVNKSVQSIPSGLG